MGTIKQGYAPAADEGARYDAYELEGARWVTLSAILLGLGGTGAILASASSWMYTGHSTFAFGGLHAGPWWSVCMFVIDAFVITGLVIYGGCRLRTN